MSATGWVRYLACALLPLVLCALGATHLGATPSQDPAETAAEAENIVDSEAYLAGVIAAEARDYEGALEKWNELLQANPDANVLLLRIAEAHGALGHREAEEAAYKRFLKAEPENLDASFALARAHLRADRMDDAGKLFEAALARAIDNAALHVRVGDVYLSERHRELALESYRRALEIDPELAVAHKQIGLAHVQGRDLTAAAAALETFLEMGPTESDADIVRALLEAIEAQPATVQ